MVQDATDGLLDHAGRPEAPDSASQSARTIDLVHSARVLVVDDDDAIRQLVVTQLSEVGLQVDNAVNGADALDRLGHAGPPELMLVDLMMPVVDGFQLVAQVKKDYPAVRIVAMSAMDYRQEALAAGFEDFLLKPFDIMAHQLPDRIQLLLAR